MWFLGAGCWLQGPGWGPWCGLLAVGSRVQGPGCGDLGAGTWVLDAGCWVWGPRCWVLGVGSQVQGAGCRVLSGVLRVGVLSRVLWVRSLTRAPG